MDRNFGLFLVWLLLTLLFGYASLDAFRQWRRWRDVLMVLIALATLCLAVNSALHACARTSIAICEHRELVKWGRVLLGTTSILLVGAVHEYKASRSGRKSFLYRLRAPLERRYEDERESNGLTT